MIFRCVFTVGLLMWLATAGVAQDEAQVSAQSELDAGVQAFKQAHYEDAINHFEQAALMEPNFTLAHLYLAAAYSQMFVPGVDTPDNVIWATKALEQYSEILRTNPSDIESIKGLAYLNFQLNSFEQAKEDYAKAIALDPKDPELLYAAAVVNWSIANREVMAEKAKVDAESDYSLILSEGCRDARSNALAGIDQGIAMLTKAMSLRKDYDDAMAYMNLTYRLRAELECGNKKAYKADLQQADEWSDRSAAAKTKKADAAKDDREKAPGKPRL